MTSGDVAFERMERRLSELLAMRPAPEPQPEPQTEPDGDRHDGFVWTCQDCGLTRWTRFMSYGGLTDDGGYLCWWCADKRKQNKSAAVVAALMPQDQGNY